MLRSDLDWLLGHNYYHPLLYKDDIFRVILRCNYLQFRALNLVLATSPLHGLQNKKRRKLKVSRLLLNLADSIEVKWITTKLAKEYLTTGCRIVAFY